MFSRYSLARAPASYDVVAYLCALEAARIAAGEDSVGIYIEPGPNQGFRKDKFWPEDIEIRQIMLNRVVLPMMGMLPSVKYIELLRKSTDKNYPFDTTYGLKVQIGAMAQGIRPLRARNFLTRKYKTVTVTIRESEHWPERNSDKKEWMKACDDIRAMGYTVIVIPDTFSHYPDYFGDHITSSAASKNLDLRASLYTSSVCNLFVSNGPAWFALALNVPVLMIKPVTENLMPTCGSEYFKLCGIPIGGQIPSSPAYQRLVWEEDTRDNIVWAFQNFMDITEA